MVDLEKEILLCRENKKREDMEQFQKKQTNFTSEIHQALGYLIDILPISPSHDYALFVYKRRKHQIHLFSNCMKQALWTVAYIIDKPNEYYGYHEYNPVIEGCSTSSLKKELLLYLGTVQEN